MKQLTAKLKSRGTTAAVLTLALGAAVYLSWSFLYPIPLPMRWRLPLPPLSPTRWP